MKKILRKVDMKRAGRKERKERMKELNLAHKKAKENKQDSHCESIRISSKEKRRIQKEIRTTKELKR